MAFQWHFLSLVDEIGRVDPSVVKHRILSRTVFIKAEGLGPAIPSCSHERNDAFFFSRCDQQFIRAPPHREKGASPGADGVHS
jgi:hypothetical protein